MSRIDVDGDEFMAPVGAAANAAAAAVDSNNKFTRPSTSASVASDLFAFSESSKKNFTKQYATLYFTRLTALKATVMEAAKAGLSRYPQCARADGSAPRVCDRILDMVAGEFVVIAGTLFKDMKLKPCILDEYARTSHAATTAASSTASGAAVNYMSADDTLVLEDEYGRVPLTIAASAAETLPIAKLVTGIVVSVLGREVAGGKFEVHALFVPEMAPQKTLAAPASAAARPPAYMLCVSGLRLGAPGQDPMPVQLLMDYVTGLLGSTVEQSNSARIVRVLLPGNSLHRFEKRTKGGVAAGGRGTEDADADEAMAPLRELDLLLTQLAAAVPVDILPGETDPSNFTLPQQPLHKCLLPSASTYSTLGRLTNPAWTTVHDGLQCLATAGQNVNDLAKYCEAPSAIDFLESSLRWRCVAPTAPDTLGCYPYQQKDPFVLAEAPHMYIVGNQAAYETRLCRGPAGQQVRAVCVPTFATTGTAVLIDLNSPTLATQPIAFKVQL